MGAELGWDDARLADEVDHYLRRVEAERRVQAEAHRPGGRRGPGQGARHRLAETAVGASASFTSETSGGSGTASGRNQRNARLPRG